MRMRNVRVKGAEVRDQLQLLLSSQPAALISWWRVWGTAPVLSWIRAADHFRRGEYRQAKRWYKVGLEKYPHHCAARCARLDLAYCEYRLENFDSALAMLKYISRGKHTMREAFVLRAKIFIATARSTYAIATLAQGLRAFPDDNHMLALFAHTVYFAKQTKRRAEAVHKRVIARQQALDLEAADYGILEMARAHYELNYGNRELGERSLVRVLATGEAPFEAYLIRGEQFVEQGRVEIGREQLSRAMSMQPLDPRPVAALAKSYLYGAETNSRWAESLATRAASLGRYQDADVVELLVTCARIHGDKDAELLFESKLNELRSTSELDVAQIRKLSFDIQRLQQLK